MCRYCEIDNITNEAKRNIRKNQRTTIKIVRNACNENLYYLSVDTNSYKKEIININYCPMCRKKTSRRWTKDGRKMDEKEVIKWNI